MTNDKRWILLCPRPECGTLADKYYNLGPMMKDDLDGPTDEDAHMQVICGVTLKDYKDYSDLIKKTGARVYLENEMCGDRCIGFELNSLQYHVNYFEKRNEIRVIEDPASIPLDKFEYELISNKKTLIYPYALYYDPGNMNTDITINCGMIYIIRLSDGSLFVVDGGYIFQHSEKANDALFDFMYKISAKTDTGKIRISCWYFTHGHDDHMDGCTRLITRFHDKIEIERVMHGFQSRSMCGGFSQSVKDMKKTLTTYYPNLKCLRLHYGQKIHLSDMTVNVLYSTEDLIPAESLDKMPLRDFNATSTIVKLIINGSSFMMLGDSGNEIENFIDIFGYPELWKADMVQVAHHCFNHLPKMYSWISAPIASVPNRYFGAHRSDNIHKLREVMKYIKNGQLTYSGDATYEYEVTDDGIKQTATYPLVAGPFDKSWSFNR